MSFSDGKLRGQHTQDGKCQRLVPDGDTSGEICAPLCELPILSKYQVAGTKKEMENVIRDFFPSFSGTVAETKMPSHRPGPSSEAGPGYHPRSLVIALSPQ